MIARRIRQSRLPPLVLVPVLAVLAWARGVSSGVGDAWGPFYKAPAQPRAPSTYSPQQGTASTSWVRRWNEIAIDASGLDHTPVAPGENRVFGEQFGPGRASRAMAIVHIAIFDAVNAIAGVRACGGTPPASPSRRLGAPRSDPVPRAPDRRERGSPPRSCRPVRRAGRW